jgi:hypothetical protein
MQTEYDFDSIFEKKKEPLTVTQMEEAQRVLSNAFTLDDVLDFIGERGEVADLIASKEDIAEGLRKTGTFFEPSDVVGNERVGMITWPPTYGALAWAHGGKMYFTAASVLARRGHAILEGVRDPNNEKMKVRIVKVTSAKNREYYDFQIENVKP